MSSDTTQSLIFKKSSFSAQGDCVEVAREGEAFFVRDSKNVKGAVLQFNKAEWQAFVAGVGAGEFNA